MKTNDFQLTNELLEKIVGGKNSANLFAEPSPSLPSEDKICTDSCTETCNSSFGTDYGTHLGKTTPPSA